MPPLPPSSTKPLDLVLRCLGVGLLSIACHDEHRVKPAASKDLRPPSTVVSTVASPTAACSRDPRVTAGLVPFAVCAGARLFFDETFAGNGRRCGTCHPAENNYTLDRTEVLRRQAQTPNDPLFLASGQGATHPFLETSELLGPFALIKENVDGLSDPDYRYVHRAVSHTLSLSTSLNPDPADGTAPTVRQRTGWGGDGAPGEGRLLDFAAGAIAQHLTRDPSRTAGLSFRLPSATEAQQLLAFQLALGRTNELNLAQVVLTDPGAAAGQGAFVDPMRGRCNHCHGNAGANALDTGLNANFGTLTRGPQSAVVQRNGTWLHDGGFGGKLSAKPNLRTMTESLDAYGDGTFNTPPLIEAADTGPYFHAHIFGNDGTANIEAAIAFYASSLFARSPAAKQLEAHFGDPVHLNGTSVQNIGRFLRVLNAAFNLALAAQRLQASLQVAHHSPTQSETVQGGLLRLAREELLDAQGVLANAPGDTPLHPSVQAALAPVVEKLTATRGAAVAMHWRRWATGELRRLQASLGTGLHFTLGAGNLMF